MYPQDPIWLGASRQGRLPTLHLHDTLGGPTWCPQSHPQHHPHLHAPESTELQIIPAET